ncbi:hypothetical protein [Spirosoma endophyticum]|nr:hypothetical protein [Spirosoma endophyticum]
MNLEQAPGNLPAEPSSSQSPKPARPKRPRIKKTSGSLVVKPT